MGVWGDRVLFFADLYGGAVVWNVFWDDDDRAIKTYCLVLDVVQ